MQAEITPEVENLLRNGAWAVWSVSGGKDSSAAMASTIPLLDAIGHPPERRFAIHADLGRSEWKSTHAHAQRVCDQLGVELKVVRHKTHDMISRWERRGELGRIRYAAFDTVKMFGPWSASGLLFCRGELKLDVMEDFKKTLQAPVVSIVGLRREESTNRSRTKLCTPDNELARKLKHPALVWNPIAAWTTGQVFDYHDACAIPLHEAYAKGSTRLSCAFCVLGSLNDLSVAASAEQNRDLYLTQVDMETKYSFSFQPSRWLGDVAPHLLSPEQISSLDNAKRKAMERREMEKGIPPEMLFKNGQIPVLPDMSMARRMAEVRRKVSDLHDLESAFLSPQDIIDKIVEDVAKTKERLERRAGQALRKKASPNINSYLFA